MRTRERRHVKHFLILLKPTGTAGATPGGVGVAEKSMKAMSMSEESYHHQPLPTTPVVVPPTRKLCIQGNQSYCPPLAM